MHSHIMRAALILALASALSACTNPSRLQLLPQSGGALNHAPPSAAVPMDETPPPCATCDGDGGLPGK